MVDRGPRQPEIFATDVWVVSMYQQALIQGVSAGFYTPDQFAELYEQSTSPQSVEFLLRGAVLNRRKLLVE